MEFTIHKGGGFIALADKIAVAVEIVSPERVTPNNGRGYKLRQFADPEYIPIKPKEKTNQKVIC